MQQWAREVFGSIRRQIKSLKAQLVDAKVHAQTTWYSHEIKDLEAQLREVFEREEVFYRQRSRIDWLQAGDQNTKYFQNRASHCKRKNTIRALHCEDGSKCSVDEEMRELLAYFYENLFSSEGSSGVDELLDKIVPCVCD